MHSEILPCNLILAVLPCPLHFVPPDKPANIKTPFKDLFQLLLLGMSSAPRKIQGTVVWRVKEINLEYSLEGLVL